MRLSLQQDQIKSLVKEEKRSSPTMSKMSAKGSKSGQEASKFYLYPREGEAGEPDIVGGTRSPPQGQGHTAQQVQDQGAHTQSQGHPTPQSQVQPQGHSTVRPGQQVVVGQYGSGQQYGLAPGNFPPYVAPPPHMGAAPVYSGPPGMPHYVPQYNHTSPQHGYIYPPGVAGLATNAAYQGPMWSNVPGHPSNIPHYPQHPQITAHTMTVTAQPTIQSPSRAVYHHDMPSTLTSSTPHSQESGSAVQSPARSVNQSPSHSAPQVSPPQSTVQSPHHSVPQSPSKRQSPSRHTPSPDKVLRGTPTASTVNSSPSHSEGGISVEGEIKPLEPIPSPPRDSPVTHQEEQGETL